MERGSTLSVNHGYHQKQLNALGKGWRKEN